MIIYKPLEVEFLLKRAYMKKFIMRNLLHYVFSGLPISFASYKEWTMWIQVSKEFPEETIYGQLEHEALHMVIEDVCDWEVSHYYDRICLLVEESREKLETKFREIGYVIRRD